MQWWEKTIEYKFVLQAAKLGVRFAAPLAGTEERAGDAMFGDRLRWVLIEFKRGHIEKRTEREKFQNFDAAARAMSGTDAHHFLVFGFLTRNATDGPEQLGLSAETYFGGKQPKSLPELLASGVDADQFFAYLMQLVQLKKQPKSGGGLTVEDFGLVAGVDPDGGLVACLNVKDFLRSRELNQDRDAIGHAAPERERERSRERDRDR